MKIALLSDLHLLEHKHAILHGQDPYLNLSRTLKQVVQLNTDFLILPGDLADDGKIASYQLLSELISTANIKTFYILGNHDDATNAHPVLQANPLCTSTTFYVLNNWGLIFINSVVRGESYGYIDAEQISLIHNIANANSTLNLIIFLHHQPIPVNTPCIDKLMLKNYNDFNACIAPYENIKGVFFGHVHLEFTQTLNNIYYASCPSTLIQITPQQQEFAFTSTPPGFRIIELNANNLFSYCDYL